MSTAAQRHLKACRAKYGNDDLRTIAAFHAARAERDEFEKKHPMKGCWYLSFSKTKAEGGFLGGVFVDAMGISDAIAKTHRLGINPGGEVLSCPPNQATAMLGKQWKNRLLSKADLGRLDDEQQNG